MKRSSTGAAWVAIGVAVVGAVAAVGSVTVELLVHGAHGGVSPDTVLIVLVVLALLGVGGLLATRVPGNPVAWLLLAVGVLWSGLLFTEAYARHGIAVDPGSLPATLPVLWLATWLWIPGLAILPTFALLLFPDGRLPSRAWRPVLWSAAVGLGLLLLAQWTVCWGEPPCYSYAFAPDAVNPLHVPGIEPLRHVVAAAGWGLLGVGFLGSLAASVVRFRRSHGDERRQMKWVIFGVTATFSLYLLAAAILAVLEAAGITFAARAGGIFAGLALGAFPVTVAVAVLKYRLYDIERVISRTVAYALITVVLAAIYGSGVVLLGGAARSLTGGGGSDLAVAASTLLAAAAFGPVRRRIQASVDRRFNRARYDARQTVEAFARRLRHEVDLDALARDLGELVAVTFHPTSVSVWVRGSPPADRAS